MVPAPVAGPDKQDGAESLLPHGGQVSRGVPGHYVQACSRRTRRRTPLPWCRAVSAFRVSPTAYQTQLATQF